MHSCSGSIFRNKHIVIFSFNLHKTESFRMSDKSSLYRRSVSIFVLQVCEAELHIIFLTASAVFTVAVFIFSFAATFLTFSIRTFRGKLLFSFFFSSAELLFPTLSSCYLGIASLGIQICLSLCNQVVQHTVQILLLFLRKAEKTCKLSETHRLIYRISQKLHHKFFSLIKISVFTQLVSFLNLSITHYGVISDYIKNTLANRSARVFPSSFS